MHKLRQVLSAEGRDQWLLSMEEQSPFICQLLGASSTILGYLLYALFPLLTLIGLLTSASLITGASGLQSWLHAVVWLLLSIAFAFISYTQLSLKFSLPSGLGLKEDKAPRLYELLAELGEYYKYPQIHRLTIHDKFSLELIQVPRFGLPFLTTNILHIGLPVLQGLSPAQFRGVLARTLGQSSNAHNKQTHWIQRWYQFCLMSQHALKKHNGPQYQAVKLFFRFYTPMLKYSAAASLRKDELEADVYMLDLMNDADVADVILRYEVCEMFLKTSYWPKVYTMLRKHPDSTEYLPHLNMAKVLRNTLNDNAFAQTMKSLIDAEPSWRNIRPVLHERLNNIGQTKLDMPPPVMETAAQRYLGDAFGPVIKLLDKKWLAKNAKSLRPAKQKKTPDIKVETQPLIKDPAQQTLDRSFEQPLPVQELSAVESDSAITEVQTDRKRLLELKSRSSSHPLSDDEAWELAYLTEKLEDKSLAITLYKQVLKGNPRHARTLFAIGRILLSRMDASGVKVLERAMNLDNRCVAQACWMLAKYYKSTGDDKLSRQYLERAAKIAA